MPKDNVVGGYKSGSIFLNRPAAVQGDFKLAACLLGVHHNLTRIISVLPCRSWDYGEAAGRTPDCGKTQMKIATFQDLPCAQ